MSGDQVGCDRGTIRRALEDMMDKSTDPHSVYGYDPESGAPREPLQYDRPVRRRPGFEDKRHTCVGCGEHIHNGQEAQVTVTSAHHVITVYAHPGHTEMARANTMQDKSWQRDQSHNAS